MKTLDSPFLMGVLHLIAIPERPLLANGPSHFLNEPLLSHLLMYSSYRRSAFNLAASRNIVPEGIQFFFFNFDLHRHVVIHTRPATQG